MLNCAAAVPTGGSLTESGPVVSQGKVMNCGGGGSCGTCIVEVLPLHPNLQHRMFATEKWEWALPTAAGLTGGWVLRIFR